ncbi:MAG: DotA/TraY family protein [Bdellovibrionales bacterium]
MIGLLTGKQIIGYMGLPRFKVRLEEIFTGGFQYISYFMALVYSAVNLLPTHHPYTQSQNIGKFGIRHVIAEAANNLVLRKENADQIILFVALLIGLVLIFIQICMLGAAIFMQPVFAMPTNFAGFFLTPAASEATDLAGIMMDLVFGVSDGTNHLFNSCVAQGITCTESLPDTGYGPPTPATRNVMTDVTDVSIYNGLGFPFPIHTAMHQMFQLYNTGLLVVAIIIASYFMVTIVVETAQTGTPFGKRFNKVWAPLRIVFAIGMLVPVGLGFNGSQWTVLYAAQFGSGFATNSWNYFNTTIAGGYFGDMKDLVSTPNIPEIKTLLQFFYTARTCAEMYDLAYGAGASGKEIKMYAVRGSNSTATGQDFLEIPDIGTANDVAYQSLNNFTDQSATVRFVFGVESEDDYGNFEGSVYPYCGRVTMKLSDPRNPSAADVSERPELGTLVMQYYYFFVLRELWFETFTTGPQNYPRNTAQKYGPYERDTLAQLPPSDFQADQVDFYREDMESAMVDCSVPFSVCGTLNVTEAAIPALQNSDRYNVNNMVTEKGWAGAAIWYNRIAEMNGAVTSSVLNIPYPSLYPDLMEHILTEKKRRNNNVPFETRFHPQVISGDPINLSPVEADMANAHWEAFKSWQGNGVESSSHITPTGNAMIDSINALFGTEGLYNIRRNPDTHPLAQIVGIGRGLVEAAVRNLTVAVVGGVGGQLLSFMDVPAGMVQIMSTFLITVTMVSLTAGFILFYIVPFLPFIYFFFAVGGWVKGIFEAMVGAPLWALAHIRIDQNGLPGQAGVAGYFLIFEIFLRPILMLFGMLASISIFSALVSVLNQVFDLVTSNVGGFDFRAEEGGGKVVTPRGPKTITSVLQSARSAIDEFFFTIIYTIVIYLMAMSSFKLIDLIPNNILRWMGQSTATFNDQREDAAQGLVGKATVGSQQTSSALGSGLKKLVG